VIRDAGHLGARAGRPPACPIVACAQLGSGSSTNCAQRKLAQYACRSGPAGEYSTVFSGYLCCMRQRPAFQAGRVQQQHWPPMGLSPSCLSRRARPASWLPPSIMSGEAAARPPRQHVRLGEDGRRSGHRERRPSRSGAPPLLVFVRIGTRRHLPAHASSFLLAQPGPLCQRFHVFRYRRGTHDALPAPTVLSVWMFITAFLPPLARRWRNARNTLK